LLIETVLQGQIEKHLNVELIQKIQKKLYHAATGIVSVEDARESGATVNVFEV
jgi:hypothetical protein